MKWQRHENLFLRASPFFGTEICLKILPGNSTWNLNITPAKRKFKFTSETSTSIFGFKMLSLKGLYLMEIGENLLIRVPWDVPTGLSLWFDTSHQLPRTESAFPTLKLNEGPKEANHRTAWLGFGLATASVFFTSNNGLNRSYSYKIESKYPCCVYPHLISFWILVGPYVWPLVSGRGIHPRYAKHERNMIMATLFIPFTLQHFWRPVPFGATSFSHHKTIQPNMIYCTTWDV